MQTADTILDVVLILIFIAIVDYIEISEVLKFAILVCGFVYVVIKIIHEIIKIYYFIKNKGK